MKNIKLELHIVVERNEAPAVELLAEASGLSKQRIKQAMHKGCVWGSHGKRTQRLRRVKKKLLAGDELHLYYDQFILDQTPPTPILIADEKDFSVWDKPFGMLSQGSKWGDHLSMGRWAEQHLTPQRNAFIVHRLDRAATGLMMLAHNKKAAAQLSALFKARKISKDYQVWVEGEFSPAKQTFDQTLDGKESLSHAVLNTFDADNNLSLLDVGIETGRKHQIRRHLSMGGFPVIGDRLYGKARIDKYDLQLRARQLCFISPFDHQEKRYQCAGLSVAP